MDRKIAIATEQENENNNNKKKNESNCQTNYAQNAFQFQYIESFYSKS